MGYWMRCMMNIKSELELMRYHPLLKYLIQSE